MNKARLLNVARALRESPDPDMFSMRMWGHACGTPACALGHYATRRDLQRAFRLSREGTLWLTEECDDLSLPSAIMDHFGITQNESEELFCSAGCGKAKSAEEAALYIEAFVARKEAEASRG